jgi:hypothetical protein
MRDDFKRAARCDVGHGGVKCPCCGPKPGRSRDALRRTTRRRLKASDRRDFNSRDQG